jgi:hypothetical protein
MILPNQMLDSKVIWFYIQIIQILSTLDFSKRVIIDAIDLLEADSIF